jgi:hypothetical protein
VPALYVADGHHRSAASSRVHAKRAGTPGEHDRFLAVLFPDEQLRSWPTTGSCATGRGARPRPSSTRVRAVMDVEPDRHARAPVAALHGPLPRRPLVPRTGPARHLGRVRPGRLPRRPLCQDLLLGRVFGVTDPRRDPDVDFVGGVRGTGELVRRVARRAGRWPSRCTPRSIGELLAVSDAGRLMPPKSTWFEPKLRSGLFVHTF